MRLILSTVSPARSHLKQHETQRLADGYIARSDKYLPCTGQQHASEAALLKWIDREAARVGPVLILLDSRGKQLSSEDFAEHLKGLRDSGTQKVVCAIGPAGGWSAAARARASLMLSFGPITLPHSLAYVVLAEQVYRALTIVAGHPYHSGH